MAFLRRIAPAIIVVTIVGVAVAIRLLLVVSAELHWLPSRSELVTRALAACFLLSDVAIGSALVTLLIASGRRAPAWAERRLPFGGGWLWYFLMGLTVVCYVGLAPTFLLLYLQMRK